MSTQEMEFQAGADHLSQSKDRNIARIGALVFLILLLTLIFWRFFSYEYPLKEAGGLEASFGNVQIAGGSASENPTPTTDPQPQEENNPTPSTQEIEEVQTDDNMESEAVKTEPTPTPPQNTPSENTNTNNSSSSSSSSSNTYTPSFPGTGNGNQTGPDQQGTPAGKKDDLGGIGKGKEGEGTGELGAGRNCLSACNCELSANQLSQFESGNRTAYIEILVDPQGNVIEAKMASVKDFPQNAQFTKAVEIDLLKKCALKRKYNPSDKGSKPEKGVITMSIVQK